MSIPALRCAGRHFGPKGQQAERVFNEPFVIAATRRVQDSVCGFSSRDHITLSTGRDEVARNPDEIENAAIWPLSLAGGFIRKDNALDGPQPATVRLSTRISKHVIILKRPGLP